MLDDPKLHDNRAYDYTSDPVSQRAEYPTIVEWIAKGSRVVDYGCGNGSLLRQLATEKNCSVLGLEISSSGVAAAKTHGIEALEWPIDRPNPSLKDDSFDYAVCNVTIQMVMYPEVVLTEMKRVSRRQVITFPNFAHWKNRLDLLVHGRMPRPMLYGYTWYSTGHIHQLSLNDFLESAARLGLRVTRRHDLGSTRFVMRQLLKLFPNLFASVCLIELEK